MWEGFPALRGAFLAEQGLHRNTLGAARALPRRLRAAALKGKARRGIETLRAAAGPRGGLGVGLGAGRVWAAHPQRCGRPSWAGRRK